MPKLRPTKRRRAERKSSHPRLLFGSANAKQQRVSQEVRSEWRHLQPRNAPPVASIFEALGRVADRQDRWTPVLKRADQYLYGSARTSREATRRRILPPPT